MHAEGRSHPTIQQSAELHSCHHSPKGRKRSILRRLQTPQPGIKKRRIPNPIDQPYPGQVSRSQILVFHRPEERLLARTPHQQSRHAPGSKAETEPRKIQFLPFQAKTTWTHGRQRGAPREHRQSGRYQGSDTAEKPQRSPPIPRTYLVALKIY